LDKEASTAARNQKSLPQIQESHRLPEEKQSAGFLNLREKCIIHGISFITYKMPGIFFGIFLRCAGWRGAARGQGGVLDAGCWMLDAGCWMLDAGCWMLDAGCSAVGMLRDGSFLHLSYL
jgi:hypothetical protein